MVSEMSRLITIALALASVLGSPLGVSAASFHAIEVDGFKTYGRAVSAGGDVVVGTVLTPSGNPVGGFVWRATTGLMMLPDPASGGTVRGAADLSGDGSFVVGYARIGSDDAGFLWDVANGTRMLGLPPGTVSAYASAVSDDGSLIAGSAAVNSWGLGPGVIWSRDGDDWSSRTLSDPANGVELLMVEDLSSDGRVVVGQALNSLSPLGSRWEGFVWNEADGFRFMGGARYETSASSTMAVSADGATAVGYVMAEVLEWGFPVVRQQAFVWDAERGVRVIGRLGSAIGTVASGVSHDGSIVVGRSGLRAFIYDDANGMRPLDMLLTSLGIDLTGWRLEDANAVSADGSFIVGTGWNPSGNQVAWVAVIPEPSSGLLIGLGLIVLSRQGRLAQRQDG